MKILDRAAGLYRVACKAGHGFDAPASSISVECPRCGETERTAALLDRYIEERPTPDAA